MTGLGNIDDVYKHYLKVIDENQHLKKLLRECKHIMNIEKDFASCHFEKHKLNELLTKIDNAIGEKQPSFKDYITEDQLKQLKGGA